MLKIILTIALGFFSVVAICAEPPPSMRYQVMMMAAMMDGMCHAREQGGTSLTSIAQNKLTAEERDQCAYVRMGLRNGCFEHGNCPPFERWRSASKAPN